MFPRSDPFRILCTLGPPHICILTVKALRQSPARPQVRAAACHQRPISNMTQITFWKMEEEGTAEKQGARKTKKEQRTRKKEAKKQAGTKEEQAARKEQGEERERNKKARREGNKKGTRKEQVARRQEQEQGTRKEQDRKSRMIPELLFWIFHHLDNLLAPQWLQHPSAVHHWRPSVRCQWPVATLLLRGEPRAPNLAVINDLWQRNVILSH